MRELHRGKIFHRTGKIIFYVLYSFEEQSSSSANKVPPLTDLEKRILSFIEPENSEGISSKQNLPQNW
jgi:hypothetical protein